MVEMDIPATIPVVPMIVQEVITAVVVVASAKVVILVLDALKMSWILMSYCQFKNMGNT